MNKFENVDVLAALEQIMRQNTAFYQGDFEIDKEMLRQAAASDKAEDKTLLWMSRPSGTYCFRERDVFSATATTASTTAAAIPSHFRRFL